jgi:hypothetical protein
VLTHEQITLMRADQFDAVLASLDIADEAAAPSAARNDRGSSLAGSGDVRFVATQARDLSEFTCGMRS